MLSVERQNAIMELLSVKKTASVKEMAKKFFISEATIRRDLEYLESQGQIKRTYGGAIIIEGSISEIPFTVRENELIEAKDTIGRLTARFINNGDIIIIDSSTTAQAVINYLPQKERLTFITNGLKTANTLIQLHQSVYSTGGKLREHSLSLSGPNAINFIRNYHANVLLFSSRAISISHGPMDYSEEEVALRQCMIERSSTVIFMCDYSKFGKKSFCQICDFSPLDYIVTNEKPSKEWFDACAQHNVQLVYPGNTDEIKKEI